MENHIWAAHALFFGQLRAFFPQSVEQGIANRIGRGTTAPSSAVSPFGRLDNIDFLFAFQDGTCFGPEHQAAMLGIAQAHRLQQQGMP